MFINQIPTQFFSIFILADFLVHTRIISQNKENDLIILDYNISYFYFDVLKTIVLTQVY